METVGWLSVIPPVVTIALAVWTKRVYLSLALFILLGWTILSDGNPLAGLARSVETYLAAVTDPDNARVLAFSALIGAMITFTQASGGMEGFIDRAERLGLARSPRRVGGFAILVSMAVFLESNFGLLVSGSVARPLFDACRVSREKLAYLIDATCSPKCMLIPLNAWGAYVVTLLGGQGVDQPVQLLLATVPLNFYALVAIGMAVMVVITGWNVGPMREAERRVREEGKLLRDGARPMVAAEVAAVPARSGTPRRAINMILPIGVMVATVPVVLFLTGSGDLLAGHGSVAVLSGVLAGLVVAAVAYLGQGIMSVPELARETVRGVRGLVPFVVVLFVL